MGWLRTRRWSDEDTLVEKKKKNFTIQIHISSHQENLNRPCYQVVWQLKSPVGMDLRETDVYEQVLVRYRFGLGAHKNNVYMSHEVASKYMST
jgi:hypothetical protein